MFLYSLFPLYVAFPRAEYYHEFRLLACLLSPFGFAYRVGHTRTARACKVSPVRYDFAFRHAVLSDSAAVSRTLAKAGPYGSLPGQLTRSARGLSYHEAQSLHPEGLRPGRRTVYAYPRLS